MKLSDVSSPTLEFARFTLAAVSWVFHGVEKKIINKSLGKQQQEGVDA
jgi:hypothetical protein